ncbi:MAG: hypothetical protein ACTSUE_00280 [Promethearchaeota archaeon]
MSNSKQKRPSVADKMISLTKKDLKSMKKEVKPPDVDFTFDQDGNMIISPADMKKIAEYTPGGVVNPVQKGTSSKIKKMLTEESENHPYEDWLRDSSTESIRKMAAAEAETPPRILERKDSSPHGVLEEPQNRHSRRKEQQRRLKTPEPLFLNQQR